MLYVSTTEQRAPAGIIVNSRSAPRCASLKATTRQDDWNHAPETVLLRALLVVPTSQAINMYELRTSGWLAGGLQVAHQQ